MTTFYFPTRITGSIDITNVDDLYQNTADSLKYLIGGNRNTRLFELEKGCGINRFIFSNGAADDSIIKSEIRDQVIRYLPHVKLNNIQIGDSKDDINGKNTVVTWSIPDIKPDQTVTVIENIK